jgi:hypothetical protein
MESHCCRTLFLIAGTVAFHWRAVSALKIVITHVRNSVNTCFHEKDRCHFMVSHSLTHNSCDSSCNQSVFDQ